tara:strand:- start:4393 stop:5454 length:1062 start_codon:yes stop_codon:yes gene_type:complete
MEKQIGYLIVFITALLFNDAYSQESLNGDVSKVNVGLFLEDQILPIKLSYSINEIKKETNDSTYIDSNLSYQLSDGSWGNIPIELRARGNYRLKNCYFSPLKIKIKKSVSKNTPFEGNKTLKAVLPCLLKSEGGDNVIKEYIVYKLFEVISPYYFKTRLVDLDFEQIKNNKNRTHRIKGFFIEDDKMLAKRVDGEIYDRFLHPLNQDDLASVRNAFFQYMIGNTDFSQAYLHNVKLIFINKKMIPIPYDFDMAGFVDASYAVVSQIQGESLGTTSVTDRKYRGFIRNEAVFEQVRQEYVSKKVKMLAVIDNNKDYFEDPNTFSTARTYILSFFDIISNDKKYKNEILDEARKE